MTDPGSDLAARVFSARCQALARAVEFTARHPGARVRDVESLADRWLGYLLKRAAVLHVSVSPVTFLQSDPGSYHPTKYTDIGGGQMAVALQVGEYVTLTVDPTDAGGNQTADSGLTWAADQPSLVTLAQSSDGTQVNVGATAGTGLVNMTATDAAGNVSPADPITISSGPVTALGISASSPQAIPSSGVPTPGGSSGG